jgi:hypothetical protein
MSSTSVSEKPANTTELLTYLENKPIQYVEHLSLFENLSSELDSEQKFGQRYGTGNDSHT